MISMALSKPTVKLSCLYRSFSKICFAKRNLNTLERKFVSKKLFNVSEQSFAGIERNTYRRFLSVEHGGPRNAIKLPPIINKDRLILLGLGIVVVGCLVGWEGYAVQKRKNEEMMRELHSIVLQAQNCVKDQNYEEAMKLYQSAHALVENVKMSSPLVQSKVVLNIVDQLGHLAYELGNWTEAEKLLSQAESIMLQCGVPKDDDMYIEVMLRLAKLDALNGNQEIAIEKFQFCMNTLENKISVLDIYAEECSDRITLYGLVLTEYGTYARELGLLDESESAFSKALNICRNVLGPTHEQTSVLANDLATVYDEKGRYNKAIRLAEKAIRIAEGTSPENLATYKYNLGHILMHKGDFQKARGALREALQLAEENEDQETKQLIESSMMKLDVPSS